jgi:arylsulfatase A-like enzyme
MMNPVETDHIETVVGDYDGEIAYIDDRFGTFFEELDKRGIFDNTIIVFTSDHGEEFFEHKMWGHGHSLYNEVVKIPLIIRYPRMIPRGTRVTAIASLVDVMPTLLDLSGIVDSVETAGRSLLPVLQAGDSASFSFDTYGEVLKGGRKAWFLTDGTFKLLKSKKGILEKTMLFYLLGDESEYKDLSDSLPGLRDSLMMRMDEIHRLSSSRAVEKQDFIIDKSTEDQLKALGYIH